MMTKLEVFKSPRFTGKLVLADIEFFESLKHIDQLAEQNGLQLLITSSARLQGVPINGAIVSPASRSNHLVGHAIDMNILLNGKLFNGDALSNDRFNQLSGKIQQFIDSIRDHTILRWGGDFDDPVHIDDGLNVRNPAAWDNKFQIIQSELLALSQPNREPGQPRLLQLTQPMMQSNDVLDVQKALIRFGFAIDADGIFGTETDAAVTAFQRSKGLVVDGVVGDRTRQALGL